MPMKKTHRLISEPCAKFAARFMKYVCYGAMLFFVTGIVLSLVGRQRFILHTFKETYDNAIYAEESHEWTTRGPTVGLGSDDVYVAVNDSNGIDFMTQVGLSAMLIINFAPLIISFWFLSRVFGNISQGRIFITENASCLLYYGLIQMAVAVLVPFIKLFICYIANLFTDSEVSIATGRDILIGLIPNIAFLVAAYIVHYGVHLQDEAEHTL